MISNKDLIGRYVYFQGTNLYGIYSLTPLKKYELVDECTTGDARGITSPAIYNDRGDLLSCFVPQKYNDHKVLKPQSAHLANRYQWQLLPASYQPYDEMTGLGCRREGLRLRDALRERVSIKRGLAGYKFQITVDHS